MISPAKSLQAIFILRLFIATLIMVVFYIATTLRKIYYCHMYNNYILCIIYTIIARRNTEGLGICNIKYTASYILLYATLNIRIIISTFIVYIKCSRIGL